MCVKTSCYALFGDAHFELEYWKLYTVGMVLMVQSNLNLRKFSTPGLSAKPMMHWLDSPGISVYFSLCLC